MQTFSISPKEMGASLWRNRDLICTLAVREIQGRYRGSLLGLVWAFFTPIIMLAVYTFVFSIIFKARWNSASDSKTEFALVLFAGLLIFNLFAECISKAPTIILANANYVKKVVFPLEILSWVTMGSALFHAGVSLLVWLLTYCIVVGLPPLTALWLPFVILPFLMLIMGVSWMLASLGVFLRDVSQVIGLVLTSLMFLSPIFYPVNALPADYQYLLFLNPITPAVEIIRDVLYWAKSPDLGMLSIYTLASSVIAWLGFAWFQKTRKGFADVL
jgi:lipopolysaccharide transport system permease protein